MKYIKNTNNQYAVTVDGKVISYSKRGKGLPIKPKLNGHGYHFVNVLVNGEYRRYMVHRLVAEYYLEDYSPDKMVLHIDDNRQNNHASNLKIGSHAENSIDMMHNGNHKNSKLTIEDVKKIRVELKYRPYRQIAEDYGVSKESVYGILSGRTWAYLGPLELTDEEWSLHSPPNRRIHEKVVNKVRKYYQANPDATFADVALRFGLNVSTTRRMIRGLGTFSEYSDLYDKTASKRNRRLDYKDEIEIRRLFATGEYRKKDIVDMYGVDFSVITRILRYGYRYKRPEPKEEQPVIKSLTKPIYRKEAEDIRKSYKEGATPLELADKHEISITAVRSILGGRVGGFTDIRRKIGRKRGRKPITRYYAQGERNRMSKLNEEAVQFIRETMAAGEYSQKELAEMFGVSGPVVYYAAKGVTWAHV